MAIIIVFPTKLISVMMDMTVILKILMESG